MDVIDPTGELEALTKLQQELQDELEGLVEKQWALESQLEVFGKGIESTRRQLELVTATKEQLAAQGREQRAIEGGGSGASTQVRGSAKLATPIRAYPFVHGVTGHTGSPQATPSISA
jgi:hypothetical protein